jgi:3D (Asp-Asp-Asp) domain-containing protein
MPMLHRSRLVVGAALCAVLVSMCAKAPPPPPPEPVASVPTPRPSRSFEATAYTIEGKTASGAQTRDGIVAADPKILPLGTRIRVTGAGRYDGEYLVADTGREIKGAEIDIYIRDYAEAKRFGRQQVNVEVLSSDGKHQAAR